MYIPFKKISNKSVDKSLIEMNNIAVNMKEALLKGEVKRFADLLHDSWMIKQKMNKL